MSAEMKDLITYSVTDAALAEMKKKYLGLRVLNPDDAQGYEVCKEARKVVRQTRIDVEKRREELKAESLAFGRAVDAEAKRITSQIQEVEGHLVKQLCIVDDEKKRREDEAIRLAKERLDNRLAQLQAVRAEFRVDEVAKMSEDEFNTHLERCTRLHEQEQLRLVEERQRLEQLEAERAEVQRQIDEKDRQIREQEEVNRRLQAEVDAKQREEDERKRKAAEEAFKESERKAAEMRAAQERAEAEAARKAAEEAEAKRKAEADAARKVADKKLFEEIKEKFPTLALAWIEIARLRRLASGGK